MQRNHWASPYHHQQPDTLMSMIIKILNGTFKKIFLNLLETNFLLKRLWLDRITKTKQINNFNLIRQFLVVTALNIQSKCMLTVAKRSKPCPSDQKKLLKNPGSVRFPTGIEIKPKHHRNTKFCQQITINKSYNYPKNKILTRKINHKTSGGFLLKNIFRHPTRMPVANRIGPDLAYKLTNLILQLQLHNKTNA